MYVYIALALVGPRTAIQTGVELMIYTLTESTVMILITPY
jgi:hypothetical protein